MGTFPLAPQEERSAQGVDVVPPARTVMCIEPCCPAKIVQQKVALLYPIRFKLLTWGSPMFRSALKAVLWFWSSVKSHRGAATNPYQSPSREPTVLTLLLRSIPRHFSQQSRLRASASEPTGSAAIAITRGREFERSSRS